MALHIVFAPPMNLAGYNRCLTEAEQPSHIPRVFLDAMKVRERVFVMEQGVPLSMEADSDDARCCHWVAYVDGEPVGTVRLVPFPQDLHPLPGSCWELPEEDNGEPVLEMTKPEFKVDRVTSLHDGLEAYVKFGRWAVVKEARGRAIAGALIEAAVEWLQKNPTFFDSNAEGLSERQTRWNGLICAHAQKYIVKAWQKLGFVIDNKMGEWSEANIVHVGVWKRISLL